MAAMTSHATKEYVGEGRAILNVRDKIDDLTHTTNYTTKHTSYSNKQIQ
jgi:hypothetical protein